MKGKGEEKEGKVRGKERNVTWDRDGRGAEGRKRVRGIKERWRER